MSRDSCFPSLHKCSLRSDLTSGFLEPAPYSNYQEEAGVHTYLAGGSLCDLEMGLWETHLAVMSQPSGNVMSLSACPTPPGSTGPRKHLRLHWG